MPLVQQCDFQACHQKLDRVMVLVGQCRCKKHFCRQHRQAENHLCTFDFKMALTDRTQNGGIKSLKGLNNRL